MANNKKSNEEKKDNVTVNNTTNNNVTPENNNVVTPNVKTYSQEEVEKMLEDKETEFKKMLEDKENALKEIKKAEQNKKYKICIPISEMNPQDKVVTVGVNEMYATIQRGVETEVELAVYEQLKNAGLI